MIKTNSVVLNVDMFIPYLQFCTTH
jgi:hypothetical protein